jgi:protein gp37
VAEHSKIEWTDATWNPVTGCTKVSPGCTNCYAETFAERFRGVAGHPYAQGFDLKLWPDRVSLPLRWKKPRMIFVNSMSDLFHERVPSEFIRGVFEVMQQAHWHTFQVLTKRADRMAAWASEAYSQHLAELGRPWPRNVWMGVSVENQRYASRVTDLVRVPATTRFLSLEPLLELVELNPKVLKGVHWVIVGGESGPRARPMRVEWVRAIRDACLRAGVPFFFKQWGAHNSTGRRVGKAAAGRRLDGRVWNGMPI